MQNFLVVGMLSREALHLRRPDVSLRISVCPGILAHQVNVITQLRRKVRNSALRNKKLTQLVTQLKSEVCDLKRHP